MQGDKQTYWLIGVCVTCSLTFTFVSCSVNHVAHAKRKQARTVYTGSFQFAQLEQSPHVRTAGRAFYHGSWGRPDLPKDTTAGESNSSSTSSSSEGSGGPAGRGPEIDSGSSEEDWEEEMEEGTFGLDRTARRDEEGVGGAVTGTKQKESKRRFAWGWPKKKGKEGKREKKRRKGNSYGGGGYVDDPGTRNDAAGVFGDGSDDDGGGAGVQTRRKRESKDRIKKKRKEEKRKRKKKKSKKSKHREKNKSKPHGEGYVEFLDGWGVSKVGTYGKKLDGWFCWATAMQLARACVLAFPTATLRLLM